MKQEGKFVSRDNLKHKVTLATEDLTNPPTQKPVCCFLADLIHCQLLQKNQSGRQNKTRNKLKGKA